MNAYKLTEYPKWDTNSGTLPRELIKKWYNAKNNYWVVWTINDEILEYSVYIDGNEAKQMFMSLAKKNKPVEAHTFHNFNIMMSHSREIIQEYIDTVRKVLIHDYTNGYVY
tara:strand:+ start:490 stop:822 length:333 start_codon:yes stop_codon:yes gene_type:complete